ncbi:MAG: multicopper oxidase domain-containing protein [Microthrixaceae bacterium]
MEQERKQQIGFGVWTVSFGVAAMALILALIALYLPRGNGGESVSSAEPLTIDVSLTEMKITPASVELQPGQALIVNVTNDGTMPHDWKVDGTNGTAMLDPGQSETVTVGPFDASSTAWCTVPGHKEAGMVMDIVVAGATHSGGHGDTATGGDSAGSDFATIDSSATPAADWQPYDPTLAPAPGGTEHTIEMHAIETLVEVAPGVTQMMWTFDGKVPGTILRGKVGDLFTVTLYNDGQVGHSLDFHASKVAWDDEMRTINSGESLVYQFKADYAGAYMYHCGTAPALHHIGNGMFGAIIIDPPNLPPVDHEFIFVQSELYLGPEAKEGDLGKMLDEDDDAVVFNGYYNQYMHSPIRVETGERIRAWVVDAGPSENSSFHIVGTIFDTTWKEGTYLLRPDERRGGSQALDLQPAQGGFVEFTFAEDGFYPIVTHKFAAASRGAMGLFQAGDVELPEGASH